MSGAIRPKKHLGQHFLREGSFPGRIVESACIFPGDAVIEIGPGRGVLTDHLIRSPAAHIVAVEIDPVLAELLKSRYREEKKIQIHQGDFLKWPWEVFLSDHGRSRIVGNLPYNLTTPILFRILEYRSFIKSFTVTVQKEVGERLVSRPGCKQYGIPSVFFQTYADVRMLFNIPPAAFQPSPNVDSSVVHGTFREKPVHPINNDPFFWLMTKRIFGQRRKMIRNTLKGMVGDEVLKHPFPVALSERPEMLDPTTLIRLSNELWLRHQEDLHG